MPKQKTRKSVSKRFRITRRGKLLHKKGRSSHLLAHRSRKSKRAAHRKKVMSPVEAKRLKRLLGLMG